MKFIINIFIYIINLIHFFFDKVFKRDFRGLLFDRLQIHFTAIKVENKLIKIFTPNSILSWRAKTYLTKEPDTLKWIKSFNKKKINEPIFWDIGANIGLYSIYSCITNNENIKVVSFEPSVNNLKSLAINIFQNGYSDQIKVFPNPLGNLNSFSELHESSILDGSALNSFSNNLDFEGKPFIPAISYKTLGYTLDYLVESSFIEIPNFIKIDVDGNEHIILEGFKKNLKNPEIFEIMIEVNENYQKQLNVVLKILEDSNFFLIEKFKASDSTKNIDKFSNTYNYLFKR